jgi:hypothetical protein
LVGKRNHRKSVASPKKQKKPNISVHAVTKIEEAIAGSIFKNLKSKGTEDPTKPARVKFMSIAKPITPEIYMSLFNT